MHELPISSPEHRKVVADNARKFIVEAPDLLLPHRDEVVSYLLITDWIATGEDDEEKIVYKEYTDGTIEHLHIKKSSVDGKRSAEKRKITTGEYEKKLEISTMRVEKRRHEFMVEQNGIVFDVKYDEFVGSRDLRMLEVDAKIEENRDDFDPTVFLGGDLTEVSGDRGYEGYRVANKVDLLGA